MNKISDLKKILNNYINKLNIKNNLNILEEVIQYYLIEDIILKIQLIFLTIKKQIIFLDLKIIVKKNDYLINNNEMSIFIQ